MKSAIAVKAFIVKDNKLFIVKRSINDVQKPGIWEIPGGRLDLEENPFEGLKREVKEETNLDIEVNDPLIIDHFTRDDGQKITMITFICNPTNKEIKLSHEHSDYDWLDLNGDINKLGEFFHKYVNQYNKTYGDK